jgi:hypothetical protein
VFIITEVGIKVKPTILCGMHFRKHIATKYIMKRIKEILLDSPLDLSAFLLGIALVAWGIVAYFLAPDDYFNFAQATKYFSIHFWLANYILVGIGFVLTAIHRFPPVGSMLVGAWATLVWGWIAFVRLENEHTSGIVLNFIVILVGILLVQRSSRK